MRRPFYIDDPPPNEDHTTGENPTAPVPELNRQPGVVRARLRALRTNPTARRIGSVGGGLVVASGIVIAGVQFGTPHTTVSPDADPAAPPLNLPPVPPPMPPAPAGPPSSPASRPIAPPPAPIPASAPTEPVAPPMPVAAPAQPIHHGGPPARHNPVRAIAAPPVSAHFIRRPPAHIAAPATIPPNIRAVPSTTYPNAPQLAIADTEFRTFAGTLLSAEHSGVDEAIGRCPTLNIESYLDGLVGSTLVILSTQ